jgi:hypothetical protein
MIQCPATPRQPAVTLQDTPSVFVGRSVCPLHFFAVKRATSWVFSRQGSHETLSHGNHPPSMINSPWLLDGLNFQTSPHADFLKFRVVSLQVYRSR